MQTELKKEYEYWLSRASGDLKAELEACKGDDKEIEDRFFRHLEFGTGGLRGVIGAGTNRMNVHTIKRASLGLANYVNAKKKNNRIVISYDSRNFSKEFAYASAEVFATNGIETYIFDTLRPTPLCSYAVRALGCDAGVMVTASHNPKIYNGYKAYGDDGCQITNEMADGVLAQINAVTDYFGVETESFDALMNRGMIKWVPSDVYEGFLKAVEALSVEPLGKKNVKIVYSPLNGTGNVPVREILRRRGFDDVTVVPEQEMPDGNFTTCPFPNPEIEEALSLALALGKKTGADLVMATDPDCDRVGIAVNQNGTFGLISGNEVGILLTDYLLRRKKENGTLPSRPVIVKTIVSTDLIYDIGQAYDAEIFNVLTGFKFIGGVISDLEEIGEADRFVLGFEESYGYMSGGHVRDKDAVNASMLIAEMCDYHKARGKTLVDVLEGIYQTFGYAQSYQKSIAFLGSAGLKDMNALLSALRQKPFATIGGAAVTEYKDYLQGIDGLPKSDVLSFQTADFKLLIRPSGTEPKLKIYLLAKAKSREAVDALSKRVIPEVAAFFAS